MKVLCFGIAKEMVGERQVDIDVTGIATVGEFRRSINEQYERLGDLSVYMVAVNEEYAEDDKAIQEGDVVAIIPPVSGG